MRSVSLLTPVFLVACTAAPAQPVSPTPIVHGETPRHTCSTEGTDRFIGMAGDRKSGSAIKATTHAAVLRWAPVGYAVSMDFRADRVTIWLDEQRKITKVSCG